jgi:hypothetical protein
VQPNGASGGVQIGVDQTTANLLYQDFKNNSEVPSGNSGNVAAGVAGTLSPQYLAAVQEMINDLRWTAGEPGTITLDRTLNADAQSAALADSESNMVTEVFPPNFPSGNGAEVTAPDFTSGQALFDLMVDFGGNNTFVGHRRALLDPLFTTMGWGEESASSGHIAVAVGYMSQSSTLPITAVAWPPPGAFPLPWLPDATTHSPIGPIDEPMRWSLQMDAPDADFSQASVSVTQNGVPQVVTIESAEPPGGGSLGVVAGGPAITWILPFTLTGEQAATYSVTISGILDADRQPLPDISYTTTTFVPTPTTGTLPSQVQFLAPGNQTDPGSATSTVTLARSLDFAGPLSVLVQGAGSSQEVEFAAGQVYASVNLPVGSFTLTDPEGGVIAPGGGTTQVELGTGGGAGEPAVFEGENLYTPSPTRKAKHPKPLFELNFSAPINQRADVNPRLFTVNDTVPGKGRRHSAHVVRIGVSIAPGPSSSSLLVTAKGSHPKGILRLTGAGLIDAGGLIISTFTTPL